jgi:tRNA 2-selenouridine synthase
MVETAETSTARGIEIPVVRAEELSLAHPKIVIDLRSPSEFAEDHVPGAVSVPLFDDVQRALVGTLYRQVSPSAAFEEGRTIVREKIRSLVGEIARHTGFRPDADDLEARVVAMTSGGYERLSSELGAARRIEAPRNPVLFTCWRGGLRSRSVLAFMRSIGMHDATLLEGGYRSYRASISAEIESFAFPPAFVLRGLTGVGKTLVLRAIERQRPAWTLDLEALAGHRSSLLGMVGLEPCSQKMFESRLALRLRAGFPGLFVVEGESRKVGDVILPKGVWNAMSNATSLQISASLESRVRVLCDDYLASPKSRAELAQQLPRVEARMTRKHGAPSLVSMLESGAEKELARNLLEHYYDPLYRHTDKNQRYAAVFEADDPERAAHEIVDWLERASA